MTVNVNIWSKSGNISLPAASPVPIWGFSSTAGAVAQLPGPLIEVMEGDDVEIILTNDLTTPVSLVFPGQEFLPQPVKDGSGLFLSYNQETAPASTVSYSLKAKRPGIFLYESGTNQEKQIQMGLYGVMIVRPAGYNFGNPLTWTAYGSGTGTEYDVEKILILGEIDTALHQSVAGGGEPGDFNPNYFIINGRSFPDTVQTENSSSQPYGSKITAISGQRVLLRIINAGFIYHNIRLEGLTARVMAGDSWPLKSASLDGTYKKHTITVSPGQSYDLLFTAPSPGKYIIYDRSLNMSVNGNQFPGGMMTLIEVV